MEKHHFSSNSRLLVDSAIQRLKNWRYPQYQVINESGTMPGQGLSKQTLTSGSRSSLRQSWNDKTLNASSIALEDFTGEDQDDQTSRGSRSSLASRSQVNNTYSQTYFSLDGTDRDQETASFHTALQDGFSLSAYESRQDLDYYDKSRFSREDDHSEREAMLAQTDFQVFWDGLTYKIEPKISLGSIWYDCFHLFRSRLSTSFKSVRQTKSGSYNVNLNNCPTSLLKKEPLTIIDQISGSFKSGELTAVMGPSGAGKTSLLNLLSRRQENGYTGELYVNNAHRRIKISTIPQHDHLPEYLTVCENLMFASRLKNIHPQYDHKKNIAKVSNLLGLDECLHTRTRKISGGQQKRLSIAQELLSMPDILILDEPTSGLDSLTCYKTISVLKDLVKSSRRKLIDPIAIVVTIHQPQQEVFDIFDKVYIMANGGITIYDGRPEDCVNFVQRNSGIQMPGEDYNPASFLIEIASGEYGCEPIKALRDRVKKDFVANRRKFKNRLRAIGIERTQQVDNTHIDEQFINQSSSIKQDHSSRSSNDESNITQASSGGERKENRKPFLYIDQRIVKGSSVNRGHFWLKTRILSKRCWLSFTRDPKQMIARILFHIFLPINMAVIMGTEPGQSNACPAFEAQYKIQDLVNDTIETSSDRQEELLLSLENVSLLFVLIYALSSANIVAVALSFNQDMLSSLKEFHNGWYSMTSYIAARFITDAPMEIFLPILTLSIAYPLTGQDPGSAIPVIYRITITSCAMILGSMVGETIGMIFGAIYVGHLSTALFASQGSTLPLVFVSGFVVRTKSMSKFARFLSQFSFYKHVLEITLVARYGYNVCLCNAQTFLNGHDTQLVGIPDRLKVFTEFWLNSFSENVDQTTIAPSLTSNNSQVEDLSENKTGIFEVFTKQISLFNTYGVEVESCKDIKPFHLHAYAVDEQDIPRAFLALIILLVVIRLLLFLTVKLLLHFKTSL